MALLTMQQVGIVGAQVTYAAASAGGDTVIPDDDGFITVKNASGGSITVTIVTPGNGPGGIAVPDIPVTVPAGGEKRIGPLNQSLADPTTGLVSITYSATTSVTVAAERM